MRLSFCCAEGSKLSIVVYPYIVGVVLEIRNTVVFSLMSFLRAVLKVLYCGYSNSEGQEIRQYLFNGTHWTTNNAPLIISIHSAWIIKPQTKSLHLLIFSSLWRIFFPVSWLGLHLPVVPPTHRLHPHHQYDSYSLNSTITFPPQHL